MFLLLFWSSIESEGALFIKKKKKAGIPASVICFNTVSSFTLSKFELSLRHSNTFQWYDLIPDIQVQTSWALDFKDRYIVS